MKNPLMKICIAIIITSLMSSCALIFTGTRANITIDSNLDKVEALNIDGRLYKDVTFPHVVKISRGFQETVVKAEQQGYESAILHIDKVFNPVSIINLGNLLGWGIDAASGAITKPEFKFYEVKLEKK